VRKILPVLFAFALSAVWPGVAQAQAQAQAQATDAPRSCPKDARGDCCDPAAPANPDDKQETPAADCPGGRAHRRGGGGLRDTLGDDNDTGPASPTFRSGNELGRGGGSETPGGSDSSGGTSGGPAGGAGGGPGSAGPGGGTTGGGPTAPGPVAVSSPGTRPSTGTPSGAGSGSSASKGASKVSGAGQLGRSMARTGTHTGTSVALALTLMVTGTSLRRAARPRPSRRRSSPRRRCRGRRPASAPPSWSYVDQSSAARAIEKF